jgi:hypothetical protein
MLLFASCTLVFAVRPLVSDLVTSAAARAVVSITLGIAFVLLLPVLVGVLLLSTVGSYVAVLLLLSYLLLLLVAGACVPIWLGHMLQCWFAKRSEVGLMSVLFGGLLIGILSFVPPLFFLIYSLGTVWLAGAILRHLWAKK